MFEKIKWLKLILIFDQHCLLLKKKKKKFVKILKRKSFLIFPFFNFCWSEHNNLDR